MTIEVVCFDSFFVKFKVGVNNFYVAACMQRPGVTVRKMNKIAMPKPERLIDALAFVKTFFHLTS